MVEVLGVSSFLNEKFETLNDFLDDSRYTINIKFGGSIYFEGFFLGKRVRNFAPEHFTLGITFYIVRLSFGGPYHLNKGFELRPARKSPLLETLLIL